MQPTKPAEATAAVQRKGRLSLVTHRWYLSSRVVMVLTLLFLVFCNLPGQLVWRVPRPLVSGIETYQQWEHGWPFTWLSRPGPSPGLYTSVVPASIGNTGATFSPLPPTVRVCFNFSSAEKEVYIAAMLADGGISITLSFLGGLVFEFWRRARARIWHFHLIDVIGLMLAVSLISAWYVWTVGEHRRVMETLESRDDMEPGLEVVTWQQGGVTWLRMWLGDEWFEFMDRPYAVDLYVHAGWSGLERLPSTRYLAIATSATTAELAHLQRLPNLEAIEVRGDFILTLANDGSTSSDDILAVLPRLPRVRALSLTRPPYTHRRLDRLSGLEAFSADEGGYDEITLQEIATLPRLNRVTLRDCPEQLNLTGLAAMSRLKYLDLTGSTLSRQNWQAIGNCRGLTHLVVNSCEFRGPILPDLVKLSNLESLSFDRHSITGEDASVLKNLKELRELDLSWGPERESLAFVADLPKLEKLTLRSSEIQASDLTFLVKMKNLRKLDVGWYVVNGNCLEVFKQLKQLTWLGVNGLQPDEMDALRDALPNCEICVLAPQSYGSVF